MWSWPDLPYYTCKQLKTELFMHVKTSLAQLKDQYSFRIYLVWSVENTGTKWIKFEIYQNLLRKNITTLICKILKTVHKCCNIFTQQILIFFARGSVHVLLMASAMLSKERNKLISTDVFEKKTLEKGKQNLLSISLITKPPNKIRHRRIVFWEYTYTSIRNFTGT